MILVGAAAAGVTMFTVLAAVPIDQRATPRSTPSVAMNDQAIVSAPDISNMSPRERASRLYDRVMRLHEQQKRDSLAFFMPMALAAYGAIPDIDDDGRYDMARLAMIAGELPTARVQRDAILQRNPTHLLGLLLADDLARDATDAKRIEATFVGAVKRERARALPEYSAHAEEIENALKRSGPSKRAPSAQRQPLSPRSARCRTAAGLERVPT